jgi:hypothetical protein
MYGLNNNYILDLYIYPLSLTMVNLLFVRILEI